MRVYNMEFGESILLTGNEEKLLIDMGSDVVTDIFKDIWNDVKKQSGKYQLMISHFHDDHINGLFKKNADEIGYTLPKAEKIMIPCIFDIKIGELNYSELEIYWYIFEKIVGKNNRVCKILEMLKYALYSGGKVAFLQKGKDFSVSGEKYTVIWPDSNASFFKQHKVARQLIKIMTDIGIYNEDDENLAESYFGKIRNLDDRLGTIFRELTTGQTVRNMETVEEFYSELEGIANEVKTRVDEEMKKRIKEWCRLFKDVQNNTSIVFHNKIDDAKKNVLFTGDISTKVYDTYVKPEVYKEYSVIKIPHHGTRSSFSVHFPMTKKMIISNGKNKNEKKRGKIHEGYGLKYTNTEIICTNPRCCLVKDFGGECIGTHDCHIWKKGEFYIDIRI